ncbi:MAG: thymidine phosphorylase [Saprospiraceae bacterium]|nr:thymidine phosphorylase [Saprospiraceae bacterium]
MSIIELIVKKRDGGAFSTSEIHQLIAFICDPSIPDFQISAILMAIYLKGMNEREVVDLTLAMAHSGDSLDFGTIEGIVVDKHSTGGVGDKTSLVLMPLVAAAGLKVAKISGRGLGHTGGTLDKLSVFEGFRYDLTKDEIITGVQSRGIVLTGQTDHMVPADMRMYALRDLTATVDALPLIASSIMSKKIAAGAQAILLDVKVGSGAIFSNIDRARQLARIMVSIGRSLDIPTKAILTDMNAPLGRAVGNALEVKEAIETLQGGGNRQLKDLCLYLGSKLLVLSGKISSSQDATNQLDMLIKSGKALNQLKVMVEGQGGKSEYINHPEKILLSPLQLTLKASQSGYIQSIHAQKIGRGSMYSGAGRVHKDDKLDLGAGILLHKDSGDFVHVGEALLTIYASHQVKLENAMDAVRDAFAINTTEPELEPLIKEEL